jgi:hypothetical protein
MSTSGLGISRDFYPTKEMADEKRETTQTNPRYKRFKQEYYTAGDEEQFNEERYKVPGNGAKYEDEADCEPSRVWHKHAGVSDDDVTNTYRYISRKFKKGIYVRIQDGKVVTYLPFSNANYVNEWSGQIVDTPDDIIAMMASIKKREGYKFYPNSINRNVKEWYANNSLIRNEFPLNEGETNMGNIKNMLEELCAEREIPDMEFFLNRRDYPILTRDGTEPYNHIWDSRTKPLVSHAYEKYIPILSMVTSDRFADISIPNHNDWSRVQATQGKWFPRGQVNDDIYPISWDDKIETVVFRGSSTGTGVTIATNTRLKAHAMSENGEVDPSDGVPFMNVGITKWNLRPRKIEGNPRLQTIQDTGLKLVPHMSTQEQAKYKYILHIDGHVSAFRLSTDLAMGSTVFKVDSDWKLWYSHLLKPWVHYIPVAADLSDLIDKIKWCKANDEKAKNIADTASEFARTVLCRDGVLDNLRDTLVEIHSVMRLPSHPKETKNAIILKNEGVDVEDMLEYLPEPPMTPEGAGEAKFGLRSMYEVRCVESEVRRLARGNILEQTATDVREIFSNQVSRVMAFNLRESSVCVKRTRDPKKIKEYVHETYLGMNYINKLREKLPNFPRTYGKYESNENGVRSFKIASERIHGKTLFEYLESPEFRFDEFRIILMQVFLTLDTAQKECDFVHNDLTPWNIVLYRHPPGANRTIDYDTSYGKKYRTTQKCIPVIIDFGRSNVKGHAIGADTGSSKIIDIITLILTSAKTLIKRRLDRDDFSKLMHLVNLLGGNRYMPSPLRSAKDLRSFLATNGKYVEILTGPKYELENATPRDFIEKFRSYVSIKDL